VLWATIAFRLTINLRGSSAPNGNDRFCVYIRLESYLPSTRLPGTPEYATGVRSVRNGNRGDLRYNGPLYLVPKRLHHSRHPPVMSRQRRLHHQNQGQSSSCRSSRIFSYYPQPMPAVRRKEYISQSALQRPQHHLHHLKCSFSQELLPRSTKFP